MRMASNSKVLRTIPLLVAVCLVSIPAEARYGGGTGEPNDPYQIATAEDLMLLGESPEDYDKHFKLMADIDLSPFDGKDGREKFNIIGTWVGWHDPNNKPFTGVFNGDGHVISNFTYSSTDVNSIALFSFVKGEDASISNLGLIDPNVEAETRDGVAPLVDYLVDGTVSNCFVRGGKVDGNRWVGGLVAGNGGTIEECYSSSVITGGYSVGGLAGDTELGGSISRSYSTGTVTGSGAVGGLVGVNGAGVEEKGYISNSYSTATVTGSIRVGGLVGSNSDSGSINASYSAGKVRGDNHVGGLVGRGYGSVAYCFWDMEISEQDVSAGGMGKTTKEMQTGSTFIGWWCDGAWTIDEGEDYPRLWWENMPGRPMLRQYGGGSGTASDPYLIYTAEQLSMLGLAPCDWHKHFKLMADIDLDPNLPGRKVFDRAVIAPDASNVDDFQGTLFTGVFDGNDHKVLNLTIDDGGAGNDYLGLFGYMADGEIRNLGLEECSVSGSGTVGGLLGRNGGQLNSRGVVANCYSTGNVNGGTSSGGGLIGVNYGEVSNCYSACDVSGYERVGGLVGLNSYMGGRVSDCYSSGNVNGSYDVGGLLGYSGGVVTNCYSKNQIVSGVDRVGGLVGLGELATVHQCFWDFQTSGLSTSDGGIGKTTAEMQQQATFEGWDFINVWDIGENQTYPFLRKYTAADINQDESVDFGDLAILAENWLAEISP